MRIGVVTSSYPAGQEDYAGHFVASHVRWLEAQGHMVEVVRMPRIAISGALKANGFTADAGIPDVLEAMSALPLTSRMVAGGAWAGRAALGVARQYDEASRRAQYWDAVCAHWLAPPAVVGALVVLQQARVASGKRMPFLAIAHGGDVHMLRQMKLLRPVLALVCRAQAKLVWVSPSLREQALAACSPALRDAVLARSVVSPMGIDATRFANVVLRRQAMRVADVALRECAKQKRLRLLVIARLVPVKGVGDLLAALGSVRRSCELVIVGDGPLRAGLERQARKLCVLAPQHLVHFRGALDAGAVDEELVRTDVVVIPSRGATADHAVRGEGMPVVALEALASGVPLIHSGSGGLRGLAWLGGELHEECHSSFLPEHADPHDAVRCLSQAIEMVDLTYSPAGDDASAPPLEVCSVSHVQVAKALSWERVAVRLWSHWHG